MMIAEDVSRREFLRVAGRIAAAFGLGATALPRAAQALEELYGGVAPVLWLQGSNCSGCSVSLLNSYPLMPVPLLDQAHLAEVPPDALDHPGRTRRWTR